MSIFDDIANALAPFVGGTAIAGAILAFSLTITIFVCVELIMSQTRHSGGNQFDNFLISMIIGLSFSTLWGWLPVWVVFVIVVTVAWVVIDPFGGKKNAQ